MSIEARSTRTARGRVGAAIVARAGGSARQSRAASRNHRMAWLSIVLGLLLSRRFHELVIGAVVVLAALAGLARESNKRTWARLAAWDRAQSLRYQRTAHQQRQ